MIYVHVTQRVNLPSNARTRFAATAPSLTNQVVFTKEIDAAVYVALGFEEGAYVPAVSQRQRVPGAPVPCENTDSQKKFLSSMHRIPSGPPPKRHQDGKGEYDQHAGEWVLVNDEGAVVGNEGGVSQRTMSQRAVIAMGQMMGQMMSEGVPAPVWHVAIWRPSWFGGLVVLADLWFGGLVVWRPCGLAAL